MGGIKLAFGGVVKWSLVIGHLSLVICHWSFVIGHLSLVICHWSLVDWRLKTEDCGLGLWTGTVAMGAVGAVDAVDAIGGGSCHLLSFVIGH